MTPEVERFLNLATRPLEATPNEREEAKGEFMSRITHGGVPYEMLDLAEPLDRLAGAKPPKNALRRSLLLTGAVLLTASVAITIAMLGWEIFLISQANMASSQSRYGISPGLGKDYLMMMDRVRAIAPDLPLGLHPHSGKSEETAAALAKNPDDIAMLQEHVIREMREVSQSHGSNGFTSDEQASINRLDQDNALWPLIQINLHLAKATGATTGFGTYYMGSQITSEPDFQQALKLFSEAAAKPSYSDHSTSLKRRQLDAFPPSRSLAESMVATGFSRWVSSPFSYYSANLSALGNLHCERLVAAADKEGLANFHREWKQLCGHIIGSTQSGESEYNDIFHQLKEIGNSLESAFDRLGMAVEKADMEQRLKILDRLVFTSSNLPPEVAKALGPRLKSENRVPANLTVEEALTSRRVEFLFFYRILATSLAFLALVFAGLVAFETCRRSRIVKNMARGLVPLLRKEDHLWMAGLGLALPWAWWWTITRMTPLGWRDGDFDKPWPSIVWLIQPSAGVVFAAVMLLQTARWRWGVHGGFLGLGVPLPWIGWGVATLTALSIPVAGVLPYLGSMTDNETGVFLAGVTGMAACGGLWLLWQGIMTLFTPRAGALRPNLVMRATLPWAMTGVVTLLASVAVSTALERYWFSKDPLFPSWTSKTFPNALQERIAEENRQAAQGW
ncbi:hypothetical protein [Luteolibacter soli]|uniref:Uncharacterized protein n=1 Tax=Luteolibacter soli TaxID=3135280 RepID=A0ABU9APF4_9BACT